jgi:hypothetical protein
MEPGLEGEGEGGSPSQPVALRIARRKVMAIAAIATRMM